MQWSCSQAELHINSEQEQHQFGINETGMKSKKLITTNKNNDDTGR